MGEAGKQMGCILFFCAGSSHGLAIDGEGISGRGKSGSPDPCREHLLDDLSVDLRKQPAIQRAAGSEKQTRTEELLEEVDMFTAPLAHSLGTLTIAQQRGNQAGEQIRQIVT